MSNYGKKLTKKEYEHSIVNIYNNNNDQIIDPKDEKFRKKELFINIDYRLGIDFPLEKRESLWLIHQKIEKKRSAISSTILGEIQALIFNLTNYLEKEYIKAIGEVDTKAMLNDTDSENIALNNKKIKR